MPMDGTNPFGDPAAPPAPGGNPFGDQPVPVSQALASGGGILPSVNDVQGSVQTTAQPTAAPIQSSPTQNAGMPQPAAPAPAPAPAPTSAHDAAAQQAVTPPDLTQSVIPPPVSPNPPLPPPPKAAPATVDQTFQQFAAQDAPDQIVHPDFSDVQGGAVQDFSQVRGTPAGFTGTLEDINQGAASLLKKGTDWAGKVNDSISDPTVLKAMPSAANEAVWRGLNNTVIGLGGTAEALADVTPQNDPLMLHPVQRVLDPLIAKGGKALADWAEANSTAHEKAQTTAVHELLSRNDNLAGLTAHIGSLGTQLIAIAASGGPASKGIEYVAGRTLVKAAAENTARGALARELLVKQSAMVASGVNTIAQVVNVAGMNAYEVGAHISEMTPDEYAGLSPTNAAKMAMAKTPQAQRQQIDFTASVASHKTFITSLMVGVVASRIHSEVTPASMAAVSGGVFGAGNTVATNVGLREADPNQPLTKGALVQGAFWAAVQGIGVALHDDYTPANIDNGALRDAAARKALRLRTEATMGNRTPEEREAALKQADVIQSHIAAGRFVDASHAAGLTPNDITTTAAKRSPVEAVQEASKDIVKNYINAAQGQQQNQRVQQVRAIQLWAGMKGGRTPVEVQTALHQLVQDGQLPDYIKEVGHEQGEGSEGAAAGQRPAEAGAAQGVASGQGRPEPAEGTGNDAHGQESGQAAEVSPRAAAVTAKLAEQGSDAVVAADGRVRVEPGDTGSVLDAAAHDAAESPQNDYLPPTDGQKAGGNYRKGKTLFPSPHGDIRVNIENPAGSIRKSMPGQPKWERKVSEHYGYLPGTHGADGDPLDVLVGRQASDDALPVFVVHQTDPTTGAFDELKVVMGAKSEGQAKQMYLNQYPRALHDKLVAGTPKITRFNRQQFTDWLAKGDHATPVSPISKQPMLSLQQRGNLAVQFGHDADYDALDAKADSLNSRLGVQLSVNNRGTDGGYTVGGDTPKALIPTIHRALKGLPGHEETTYNGADASTVFPSLGTDGGGRVHGTPERPERGAAGERTGRQQRALAQGRDQQEGEGGAKEAPSPRWLTKPESDAPIYQRKQGKRPVSVVGVHYSAEHGLTELDPAQSGRSVPERGRLLRPAGTEAPAAEQRVHFYVRTGEALPVKERAVGGAKPAAYETRLNNLYDVQADPDHIIERAALAGHGEDHDAIVRAILRAGYDGTVHAGVANDTPVATLFGKGKVPVKPIDDARIGEPAGLLSMLLRTRQGNATGRSEREAMVALGYADHGGIRLTPKGEARIDSFRGASNASLFDAAHTDADQVGPRYTFAGTKAVGADLDALAKAKAEHLAMLTGDEEKSTADIDRHLHNKYGWTKGHDGRWRFEISDHEMQLDTSKLDTLSRTGDEAKLGDVIQHKALFDAYPFLKNVTVSVDNSLGDGAYSNPEDMTIVMGDGLHGEGDRSPRSVMAHEIQHLVQTHEDFANGGGPDMFRHRMKLVLRRVQETLNQISGEIHDRNLRPGNPEFERLKARGDGLIAELRDRGLTDGRVAMTKAFDAYEALTGEVESRNVQARLNMKPDERRGKAPIDTESVPRNKQIPHFMKHFGEPGSPLKELIEEQGSYVQQSVEKDDEFPRYSFAGPKAETADREALKGAKAKQRDEAMTDAAHNAVVRDEFGWEVGKDGLWRFEISDHAAKVDLSHLKPGVPAKLGDIMDHPDLFAAYPFLKDMKVVINPEMSPSLGTGAGFHPVKNEFQIADPSKFNEDTVSARSLLLHEVAHKIQMHEGMAGGASMRHIMEEMQQRVTDANASISSMEAAIKADPSRADELTARIDAIHDDLRTRYLDGSPMIERLAFFRYYKEAGEVEARNVEARKNMTPEQRRATPTEETESVPRDRQEIGRGQLQAVQAGVRGEASVAEARGLSEPDGLRGSTGLLPSRARTPTAPAIGLPADQQVNGKVEHFGPFEPAQQAARDYAASAGIPSSRPQRFHPVDKARAARIAKAYADMPHAPNNPAVKASYKAMIDETVAQWHAIEKTGLKVDFIKPGDTYPYANPREMHMDVRDNNHMWVFPTEGGFGSSAADVSGNPLLADTGIVINGHHAVANDIFRIVHDYFGHVKEGNGFRASGEEHAWRTHAAMYSDLARPAMTSETRGQNSWVNFGPHGEANARASGEDTVYADQKTGIMPAWTAHEGLADDGDYGLDAKGKPITDASHHAAMVAHAAKITAKWAGAPDVVAVDREGAGLPEGVGAHIAQAVPGTEPAAMYYGGKVYIFPHRIADTADLELHLAHETLGHYGLRRTFGEAPLDTLLDSIHASIAGRPAFRTIAAQYAKAYEGMPAMARNRAFTEEYLSNRAELQANPSVLAKVTAFVRSWGRRLGMVRQWSDGDVTALMHHVAQNVRQGKVSQFGYDAPTTTFAGSDAATSTYQGAAGEGQITYHPDGSRVLTLGDTQAAVVTVLTDRGSAMKVDTLNYTAPADLLKITRFAGEEGKGGVVWPANVAADLKAAGIPHEVIGDYAVSPASTVPRGEPRLSLRHPGGLQDDPDLQARIKRTIAGREQDMTPWDRMQWFGRQLFNADNWRRARDVLMQANVDRFNQLRRTEMKLTGRLLDASESGFKMAHMSQHIQQVMGAVVRDGIPTYKDGAFQAVPGRKGWFDILAPIYLHKDPGMEAAFNFYLGTRRAERLLKETNADGTPRERNFTAADVAKGKELEAKYPIFKQVADDTQTFMNHILDLAVDRGNMRPETAEQWKENFYVPFYRALDDPANPYPGGMPGGLKISSKYLSGGGQIENPLDNMLHNATRMLDKIYKNEAVRRNVAQAVLAGEAHPIGMAVDPKQFSVTEIEKRLEAAGLFVGRQANGQRGAKLTLTPADRAKWVNLMDLHPPVADDVVFAMQGGKAHYYRIDDPLLKRSIDNITHEKALNKWAAAILGGPSKALRFLTVENPTFWVRHLFRQALDAKLQTSYHAKLFKHALASAIDTYTNGPRLRQLSMAGAGGNEYYPIDQAHETMRALSPHATVLDTAHKVWKAYEKVGFVADQMNRESLARTVLADGGSVAEAAWQAQDLLNFGMHGDNMATRYLMRAVPFLNARTQGAYRIVRGATGQDVTAAVAAKMGGHMARRFLMKGLLLTAASVALESKNMNDPRYEKLSDEQKDLYYNFFVGDTHYALPKPFELGAIFSTLPARFLRLNAGVDNRREFFASVARVAEDTLRLDPRDVALVHPVVEDAMNKSSLTQRPIVSDRYEHLDPSEQFNAFTSPTIKGIAQSLPDSAPDMLRSPLRLQHLVNGYFSTVGQYTLDAADAVARAGHMAPAKPTSNSPLGGVGDAMLHSMIGKSSTDTHNRAEDVFWDNYNRLTTAAATIQSMENNNELERYNRYTARNATMIDMQDDMKDLHGALTDAHKAESEVYQDPSLTADEKRDRLNDITRQKDEILKDYAPLLKAINDL